MSIRAVTFDFWGTLYRELPEASGIRMRRRAQALAEATGAPLADAEQVLVDAAREFLRIHMHEQHTLTPHDAVRFATGALNVTLSETVADALASFFATVILEHPPVPIDGALDAVRAAAARVPVGVISDTGISPGSSLHKLLEKDGFLPCLRCISFSDEVGVAKPQAPMFTRTAEALGVAPHELLHLGDLEFSDIVGVHAQGGQAGLFAGVNERYLAETKADHIFRSWHEFVEKIDQLIEKEA